MNLTGALPVDDPLALDPKSKKEEDLIAAVAKAFKNPAPSAPPPIAGKSHLVDWLKVFESRPPASSHRLLLLRYVTWRLQKRPDQADVRELGRELAYSWLQFLLGDAAEGRSFFLQHFLLCYAEPFYYGGRPGELRPSPKKDGWQEILPWLRRPQNLTILEMEIALAIFRWDATEPELVWWIREYPHILRRVHGLLLRTYGFALLGALTRAMKAAREDHGPGTSGAEGGSPVTGDAGQSEYTASTNGVLSRSLYQAPYLASVGWRVYPRLGGLVLIGLLGILSINYLLTPLYAAPLWLVLTGGLAALALIHRLIMMDVFKQNRGVLVSARHAQPRTLGVLWRALAWGCAGTLAACAVLRLILSHLVRRPSLENWTAYRQLPDMALPHLAAQPWWHWLLRFAVMGLGAVLLGLLLQWFWEDRSVIEPI